MIAGLPELDGADAVIMLADPYSFPVEPLLAQLGVDFPGLPVIGGLASARGPDGCVLLHDDAVAHTGAVGAVLRGVDVRACVSQGARPIGPEMVITAADGNVVHELASRPALVRLREAIGELDTEERLLAANGLLLGIVIDENRPEYERGDFLVRGLVDVDEETGSVTVGDLVRVGQTARLQVRDGVSADEDLRDVLAGQLRELAAPPAGALVFTCNGRGVGMFGAPDHDAAALEDAFGRVPGGGLLLRRRDRARRAAQLPARLHRDDGGVPGRLSRGRRAVGGAANSGGRRSAHGRACSSCAGERDQHLLAGGRAHELHADRQAVRRLVQRQRDRRAGRSR